MDTTNTNLDLRFFKIQVKCNYESKKIVMSIPPVIMLKVAQVQRVATEAVAAAEVITAVEEVVTAKVIQIDINIQDIAKADRYHQVTEETTVLLQYLKDKLALQESAKLIHLQKES